MEIPIDKIKVNNAIIVFLLIIDCLLFPLTILLDVNYKYFFEYDFLKVIGAVFCIGCTNFSIVYLIVVFFSANGLNVWHEGNKNIILQRPIILTLFILIAIYTITLYSVNKNDITDCFKCIGYCDFGIFGSLLGATIDTAWKKRKAKKNQEHEVLPVDM